MDSGRRAILAATGVGLAGLSGCSGVLGLGRPRDDGSEFDVGMSTDAFLPDELEIVAGETVVWKNTSSHAHTVTAYENAIPADAAFFSSGDFDGEEAARDGYLDGFHGSIPAGGTYAHEFTAPGEYRYFCVPHERAGMAGAIVVRE